LIRVLNYIFGTVVKIIAFLRLLIDTNFKKNYSKIENKIGNVSSKDYFLPKIILKSIILIEDRRFFFHSGVDLYSISRAAYTILVFRKLEGASTIEQQLVRTITNKREVSLVRKINEICFAVLLSNKYSKDKIIMFYCSLYDFGYCIGIKNMCLNEYDSYKSILLVEAASVIARLKYPILTSENYISYLKRVRTIEILVSNDK
jgi:membrane carboxypeptidase/penicillin-binding protein